MADSEVLRYPRLCNKRLPATAFAVLMAFWQRVTVAENSKARVVMG